MILGIFNRSGNTSVEPGSMERCIGSGNGDVENVSVLTGRGFGFCYRAPYDIRGHGNQIPRVAEIGNMAVVFTGRIYNIDELYDAQGERSTAPGSENESSLILSLYRKFGLDFAGKLIGKFAIGIVDLEHNRLVITRDHFGIEPLYYSMNEKNIVFSSSIPPIVRYRGMGKELNTKALGKYLLFNYNPGLETFYNDVSKLRPAHCLVVEGKKAYFHRYWKLSFERLSSMDEDDTAEALFGQVSDAVRLRVGADESTGIFLSGGMDSSSVASFAREFNSNKLKSYSYRCRGESFDESHYAKIMAQHVGSQHREIEYSSRDLLKMQEVTKYMNEPFCDVGINIATTILGREAGGNVSYVLTGDGGDELFGGHPVYEADKVARYFDIIPDFVVNPLAKLCAILPDSDQKKNISVKIKRFSENLCLPRELLTHRWRTYYASDQLEKTFVSMNSQRMNYRLLCEDIFRYNLEAGGPDLLSRSLYSDYQTVVDFYLRRNDLNRKFNLETRYPLLDIRLVEFCASISSSMKVKGWFDTKYIFKKAMERALPHTIVYRKDKLGHSIPLKNWIRDDKEVREYILDFTSEETIRKRGLFHYPAVKDLFMQHANKQRNNSHRIWALAVFEMWMRENFDH